MCSLWNIRCFCLVKHCLVRRPKVRELESGRRYRWRNAKFHVSITRQTLICRLIFPSTSLLPFPQFSFRNSTSIRNFHSAFYTSFCIIIPHLTIPQSIPCTIPRSAFRVPHYICTQKMGVTHMLYAAYSWTRERLQGDVVAWRFYWPHRRNQSRTFWYQSVKKDWSKLACFYRKAIWA